MNGQNLGNQPNEPMTNPNQPDPQTAAPTQEQPALGPTPEGEAAVVAKIMSLHHATGQLAAMSANTAARASKLDGDLDTLKTDVDATVAGLEDAERQIVAEVAAADAQDPE